MILGLPSQDLGWRGGEGGALVILGTHSRPLLPRSQLDELWGLWLADPYF